MPVGATLVASGVALRDDDAVETRKTHEVLVLFVGCAYARPMSGTFLGRKRFTRSSTGSVRAHVVGACWSLLMLGGCGDDGAAPPSASMNADAGNADAAQAPPMDAAPPSPSGNVGADASVSGTLSGGGAVSMVIPTTPPSGTMAALSSVPSTAIPPTATSSSPSPWVPVESPLEGQSNCRESLTRTDTQSYYRLECDPDKLWVTCTLWQGEVECNCKNETSGDFHEYTMLPDTELEVAARASISLCNGANSPGFGEQDCDAIQESSSYYCTVQQLCTRTAELAEGIQAFEETSPNSIECTEQGFETSWCSCGRATNVYGVSTPDACAAVTAWCDSELPVDDDIICLEPTIQVGGDSCSTSRECGRRVRLNEAGDVYVLDSAFTRSSYCSWDGEDSSLCSCNSTQSASITGIIDTGLEDACVIADELCSSTVPPQANGPLACGSESAQATGGTCTGSATCTQELSNGSGGFLINSSVYSACESDGNGGWSCVCNGGGAASEPEAIAAPSVIRACMNAIDSCALRGHLELGEFGTALIVFSELSGPVDAGTPADPVDSAISGDL